MELSEEEVKLQRGLQRIAESDVETILRKNAEYGGSWKKRGGVGAFMMLARKWDRLETQLAQGTTIDDIQRHARATSSTLVLKHPYDIFGAALADERDEGILDDIADLRCYLLLVENEIHERRASAIKEGR